MEPKQSDFCSKRRLRTLHLIPLSHLAGSSIVIAQKGVFFVDAASHFSVNPPVGFRDIVSPNVTPNTRAFHISPAHRLIHKQTVNCLFVMSNAPLFCPSVPLTSLSQPSSSICPSTRVHPPLAKRVRVTSNLPPDAPGSSPDSSPPPESDEPILYFRSSTTTSGDPPSISELPLFPLQMVLNPGTPVPLHIFELRYRLLFNRIRDGNNRFGIVFYDPDSSDLALYGCSAELTRFEPLPDGRIITTNVGRARFRIVRLLDGTPYTRAMVEYIRDEPPTENLVPLMTEVWDILQDVLRLSNRLYNKTHELSSELRRLSPGKDKDLAAGADVPKGWPAPEWVEDFSFAVSQILDLPLSDQQLMLQTRDSGTRLRRQKDRLETARQYLAAQVSIKEAGLGKW